MGNELFEGYIGIRSENGQYIHDIIVIMMFIMISVFAFIFRTHHPLIKTMFGSFLSVKERQNLFDASMKKNLFFKCFMKFQMLFLCTLFFYLLIGNYAEMRTPDIRTFFLLIGVIFVTVYLFYLLKQFIYFLYGQAFSKNGKYTIWCSSYHTSSYIWGGMQYVPTLWLLFDKEHVLYAVILYLTSYILYRIAVIYTTIRIFYNKNTGFLFLSSYLCAQEIIPLLFLYEGLNYFHNIIDTSILWH